MPSLSPKSIAELNTYKQALGGVEEESLERLYDNLQVQLPNFYLRLNDDNAMNLPLGDFYEETWGMYGDFDSTLLTTPPETSSATLNRIRHYQSLLEPIGHEKVDRPLTICVPLALSESIDTVKHLFEQIDKSAKRIPGGVEVIVWANARSSGDTSATAKAEARYADLRQVLDERESESVSVSTALDLIDESRGKFSMSKLRSAYMDALVGRVLDHNLRIDQPVLWLDADTTYISPDVFSGIQHQLNKNVLGFCHPDVDYSTEWTHGQSTEDIDMASKVLIADEIARRASKRAAVGHHSAVAERRYPEESGLSFTMASYLLAGGVDRVDPINESVGLIARFEDFFFSTPGQLSHIPEQLGRMYNFTAEDMKHTSESPMGVRWLNGAKIQLSGRRIYEEMKVSGPSSLRSRESSVGDLYRLFTDIASTSGDIEVDAKEIESILRRSREQAGDAIARKAVDRVLQSGLFDKTPTRRP